jgi:glutathione S-transferase
LATTLEQAEFISDFWPPGQRLIRFFGQPLAADEAKDVREKIHLSLARLEGYAEGGVWMAGSDLTAADIVAYPRPNALMKPSSPSVRVGTKRLECVVHLLAWRWEAGRRQTSPGA